MKKRKQLEILRREVEKSIKKLREGPLNQEPDKVADQLERTLDSIDS